MRALSVDSFAEALAVRRQFPNWYYTNRYQQIIIDAANSNPDFFNADTYEGASFARVTDSSTTPTTSEAV